jgi:hypothetical protein
MQLMIRMMGGTSGGQNWWQTTPITEVLEESTDNEGFRTVKFKTRNSIYIWKEF